MHKPLSVVIALSYTIVLAVLSLVSLGNIPDLAPSFSDKVFHFCSYALLCFVWYRALKNYSNSKKTTLLFWASIIAIVFGIIIEVLQGDITETRSADLKDVIANFLGIAFTVAMLCFRNKLDVKKE